MHRNSALDKRIATKMISMSLIPNAIQICDNIIKVTCKSFCGNLTVTYQNNL